VISLDSDKEEQARQIIVNEVDKVGIDSSRIKKNGCAACHVLFTLVDRMHLSETDAADLLTEVLLERPELNEKFIDMVENVHMKQRMMGVTFAIKTREAKDRYVLSQFKNALDELLSDAANYGVDLTFRKLILSHISLQLAQNLGIDFHAATEELYYYMRKHDQETHADLMALTSSILERGRHR